MGQRVLVTGASKGIGGAIAAALVRLDYVVYGTSRNPEAIKAPVDGVQYVRLDLTDSGSIDACVRTVGEVDSLINNAGLSQIAPAEEYPLESTQRLFNVNLFGVMQLTQAFLPGMRQRRGGIIINIGSLAGRFAVPFQSSYVASKFALAGYSWALRNEVMKYGIKVVVIEPNDIRTTIAPELVVSRDSEYVEAVRRLQRVRDTRIAKASPPSTVADRVVQILREKSPRPFSAVGGKGALLVFLKRFLPDSTVEKLVRRSYGLD